MANTHQLPPRAENSFLAAPAPRILLKAEAAVLKTYKEEKKKNGNFGLDGRVVPLLGVSISIPQMWAAWTCGTPSNGHLPVKDFDDGDKRKNDPTWKTFRKYRVVAQYIEQRASLLNRAPAAVAEDLDSLRRDLELSAGAFAKSIVPELQTRIRSADPHKNS